MAGAACGGEGGGGTKEINCQTGASRPFVNLSQWPRFHLTDTVFSVKVQTGGGERGTSGETMFVVSRRASWSVRWNLATRCVTKVSSFSVSQLRCTGTTSLSATILPRIEQLSGEPAAVQLQVAGWDASPSTTTVKLLMDYYHCGMQPDFVFSSHQHIITCCFKEEKCMKFPFEDLPPRLKKKKRKKKCARAGCVLHIRAF